MGRARPVTSGPLHRRLVRTIGVRRMPRRRAMSRAARVTDAGAGWLSASTMRANRAWRAKVAVSISIAPAAQPARAIETSGSADKRSSKPTPTAVSINDGVVETAASTTISGSDWTTGVGAGLADGIGAAPADIIAGRSATGSVGALIQPSGFHPGGSGGSARRTTGNIQSA